MSTFLHGLGIQFYRGIGSETQYMAPFKKFNFFIGANNSGKSTILNCLNNLPPFTLNPIINDTDNHRGAVTGESKILISISKNAHYDYLLNNFPNLKREKNAIADIFSVIIGKCFQNIDYLWFEYAPQNRGISNYTLENLTDNEEINRLFVDYRWKEIHRAFFPNRYDGSPEIHRGEIIRTLSTLEVTPQFPAVKFIPAIREIGAKDAAFEDLSGAGLIDRLAEIQSPDHHEQHNRIIFSKINDFLRSVLNKPDCSIEIPHHREHVIVHIDNKVLPLSSLGTGIHEVIMIAAFCTITENSIMCIEEPEIHLHPLLQKKLINYLNKHTSNQYFIATHSASFIDTPDSAIFHVSNDGDQTRITETVLRSDKFSLCQDLGYRASDIMQSNAVIWVEGPSDRIYINHWINMVEPDLAEGIHYSIMFYGGRLLNHLTADAEELDDFINLRSLNQNMAVVIDSDKSSARAKINSTKKRIQDELSKGKSICWITKGREIENYIDHDILQDAVKEKYKAKYTKKSEGGKYDHALNFYSEKVLIEKGISKVEIARLVCKNNINLDILDLKKRITEIVNMIKEANN